jgi:tetratricopeptide (TPR) repeat protein
MKFLGSFLASSTFLMILTSTTALGRTAGQNPDTGIVVRNSKVGVDMAPPAHYETGPTWGNILNNHFFPGMQNFATGQFAYAKAELDYFLARPEYTAMNPQQGKFMSLGHYIRGMIYLYHASGVGRHARAIQDFRSAIEWDAQNYLSRLELAHALTAVGNTREAINVLQAMLKMELSPDILAQVREDMGKLQHAVPDR